MEAESCVPPGFRFYPTEEELVGYYLRRKIDSKQIDFDVITDIDLYRIEPWDIQGRCKLGCEDKNEWYFFSHKDKKYPTGTRTNRATAAGFWKATGRDKAVLSKHRIIGMRKTLVFYKGRAPNGKKTDWIMHEYRLQTSEDAPPQDEGWVVCRAFKKPSPSHKQRADAWNHAYYVMDQQHFGTGSMQQQPSSSSDPYHVNFHPQSFDCDDEFGSSLVHHVGQTQLLPQLQSPSLSTRKQGLIVEHCGITTTSHNYEEIVDDGSKGEFIDWKTVDKLLASQLTEMASSTQSDHPTNQNQDFYVDDNTNQGNNLLDYFRNL